MRFSIIFRSNIKERNSLQTEPITKRQANAKVVTENIKLTGFFLSEQSRASTHRPHFISASGRKKVLASTQQPNNHSVGGGNVLNKLHSFHVNQTACNV